jgi:hypothetical protein
MAPGTKRRRFAVGMMQETSGRTAGASSANSRVLAVIADPLWTGRRDGVRWRT